MPKMEYLREVLISKATTFKVMNGNFLAFDYFKATCDPKALNEAAEYLQSLIPDNVNCIISPGLGALALSSLICNKLLIRGREVSLLVTRNPERYEAGDRLVDGVIPENPVAMFVDDTIVSGATFHTSIELVVNRDPSLKVQGILLIVDARHLGGSRRIHASGIRIQACFTRHELGLTRDDVSVASGGPRSYLFEKDPLENIHLAGMKFNNHASTPVFFKGGFIFADNTLTIGKIALGSLYSDWTYTSGNNHSKGFVQEPLILENIGVFAGYDGEVTSINLLTGDVNWATKITSSVHASPVLNKDELFVVGEDYSKEGVEGGSLYVLDLSGNLKRSVKFSEKFAPCTPAIVKDVCVATSNSGEVVGIVGEEVTWTYQMEGKAWGRIASESDIVFIADDQGYVYKLNGVTGELVWKSSISKSFVHSKPLVVNGVVIVSDTTIYTHGVCAATGKRIWICRTRSQVPWRPEPISDTRGILLGQDGDTSLIEFSTGRKLAETRLDIGDARIRQPGTFSDGKFALIDSSSNLRVFKVKDECIT